MLLVWLPGCSGDQPGSGSELIITDVTLIDGTGSEPQAGVDIRIADGRIVEIGPDLPAASGAETIDGSGKYVIPGLIDTHVHMDAPMVFQLTPEEKAQIVEHNPRAFLYNGVTAVLNVSSKVDWIFEQRRAEQEGRLLSPRLYVMGRSFYAGRWLGQPPRRRPGRCRCGNSTGRGLHQPGHGWVQGDHRGRSGRIGDL